MNIATRLTLLRIAIIPLFVGVFYVPHGWAHVATAALFGIGALTDWLDGYLARRLGLTSRFGAFLDPVADKLMVATVLVLLVQADPRPHVAIPAAVIIGREIAVSALREFMAQIGQRTTVAVATIGKVKTTAQMTAILMMLLRDPLLGIPLYPTGVLLLYVAAALTLWSMLVYLRAAWPKIGPRIAEPERTERLDSPPADITMHSSTERE